MRRVRQLLIHFLYIDDTHTDIHFLNVICLRRCLPVDDLIVVHLIAGLDEMLEFYVGQVLAY